MGAVAVPAGTDTTCLLGGEPKQHNQQRLCTALPTQQGLNQTAESLWCTQLHNKQWALGLKSVSP